MAEPIRIGIIGTGIFAHRHHRAYQSVGTDKYQLVACANRSMDKAKAFAEEVGIPESAVYTNPIDLIQDPNVDAVDVILPIQFNKEMIEAAIAANKHIMFEKPIAASMEDARSIVHLAKKSDVVVSVNENWAYHPMAHAVAEYIKDGGIGDIITFTYDSARPFNADSPYHKTAWRQNPEHPGGYLSDGCVHDLAHIIPIVGHVQSVGAFATQRHKIHADKDTLSATIRLGSGATGVANFTFCTAGIKRMNLMVYGSKGSIRLVDDNEVELYNEKGEKKSVDCITECQKNAPGNGLSDVEGELSAFYDTVRHNKPLGITPEDAFHHLAFIVAALKFIKSFLLPHLVRSVGANNVILHTYAYVFAGFQ